MNKALLSSKSLTWCTPQAFFDALDEEFHFALDAAATDDSAKCPRYFTPETDGLTSPWSTAGGTVFCNPPYGREIGKWVQKAYEEAQAGTRIVLLIPARTDTSYFHDFIYGKAEIRFIRGRLRFTKKDGQDGGPAPFPSMLVIYNGKEGVTGNGVTMSEASDWTKKYIACGMFGKSYDGRNIIEFVRGNHSAQRVIEQIPGQMMMEDGDV